MRRALAMIALLGAGCLGIEDRELELELDADDAPDAERYVCGGVMGLRCPPGFVCADQVDGCYPHFGHMDCIGECVSPESEDQ